MLAVVGKNVPRHKNENVINVYQELMNVPRASKQLYLLVVYIGKKNVFIMMHHFIHITTSLPL